MGYIKKRATAPFNGRVDIEGLRKLSEPSNARYDREIEVAAAGVLYPDANLDERVDAVVAAGSFVGESTAFIQKALASLPPVQAYGGVRFKCTTSTPATLHVVNWTEETRDIKYSVDAGETWSNAIVEGGIEFGDEIWLKGNNPGGLYSVENDNYVNIYTTGGATKLSGNVMSLLDDGACTTTTIPCESCFKYLFGYDAEEPTVVDAYELILPATTLTEGCYVDMFTACGALVAAPIILPATTLTEDCYNSMFENCTELTSAPKLPATTLAGGCYSSMFKYCESLEVAPALPAETLAESCYSSMFYGCTSLREIHCAAIDISATSCTGTQWTGWVGGDGVATSGDFYCPSTTDWASKTAAGTGIPSGWTRHDE